MADWALSTDGEQPFNIEPLRSGRPRGADPPPDRLAEQLARGLYGGHHRRSEGRFICSRHDLQCADELGKLKDASAVVLLEQQVFEIPPLLAQVHGL